MILIAGGGIAGLTLALSCHQAGIPCRVFEQASEIRPLGVGINVQPHAVRELFELGLEEELEAIGVRTREVAYFSKTGRLIWAEPRGRFAGFEAPQISLSRGALHFGLLAEVENRIGKERVVRDPSLRTSSTSTSPAVSRKSATLQPAITASAPSRRFTASSSIICSCPRCSEYCGQR